MEFLGEGRVADGRIEGDGFCDFVVVDVAEGVEVVDLW